jgi:AcrR family transcriptional regulator
MVAHRKASSAKRSHRGEDVIKDVLRATREELAQVGYRGLRIEDVAARAKVNKTTIYRRWPTKVDLVQETLHSILSVHDATPDTGTLRGDLVAVAEEMLRFLSSADGKVLVRMMMTEGTEKDLRKIVDVVRQEKELLASGIFNRAKARGEIRDDVSRDLMMSTMVGSLQHAIFGMGLSPSQKDLESLVDLLLYGATPRVSAPRRISAT